MEKSGRIGVGKWIAPTLEDRREKRRKVKEGERNDLEESESH
jgi:hypothetical protein